jgi:hypothetical protein
MSITMWAALINAGTESDACWVGPFPKHCDFRTVDRLLVNSFK